MRFFRKSNKTKTLLLNFQPIKSFFILCVLLCFNIMFVFAQEKSCPVHVADLSSSPTASVFFGSLNVNNPCCSAPSNHNCFTIELYLHEDAGGVILSWNTAAGNTFYYVNCVYGGAAPGNRVLRLCFDGLGPHYFTFCRTGNPTYDLLITSVIIDDIDVVLPPFNDVCEDSPLFFFNTGTPTGGTYYIDGVMAFWFDPSEHGPGTYEITYIYEDPVSGCTGSDTQTITVYPLPVVDFPDIDACMYGNLHALSGATPPGGTYFGNFVSGGNFDMGASGPGTFEIFYGYTDANGCYNEASAFITVNPLPNANAGPDQIIPEGTTANLNAAPGGAGNYSYFWSPAGLVIDPNSQNTTTVPLWVTTIFTLTVVDEDTGCINTDQVIIYVTGGDLEILFIEANPTEICLGETVQLFVLVTGGTGAITYAWTSDPPGFVSNVNDPIVNPIVTTTYYVTVTDTGPPVQTASAEITITVNPLPVVTLQPFDPVCGNTNEFILTGGLPLGGTYSIPARSLYNIASINPLQLGSGSYIVVYEYYDVNGCFNSDSEVLIIYPAVKARFHPQRTFCESHEVTFLNLSENAISFEWHIDGNVFFTNFGDPSLTYVFDEPTDYEFVTVVLIAVDEHGCEDIFSKQFKLTPPVVAVPSPLADQSGCSPLEIDFWNNSYGPIFYHLWNFGDGSFSIQNNPTHTFTNFTDQDTTYVVFLTVVSENVMCTDYDSVLVTVHPYIEAGFGFTPSTSCAPHEITIENTAIGAVFYEYYIDNVLVSNSNADFVNISLDNFTDEPIEYIITQYVENNQGCRDSIVDSIIVYPFLSSGFAPSEIEGCAPFSVNFNSTAVGKIDYYYYNFGDGGSSVLSDPLHVFENKTNATIVYTVMQIVSSEFFCSDTLYIDITVHPEITADFSFTPEFACNPAIIDFSSNIIGYSGFSYYWDFGDGSPAVFNTPDVSHTFDHNDPTPQTYIISLVAENVQNCISRQDKGITIYPKIIAGFDALPITGCSPLEVDFVNNTIGGNSYLWLFGDGGSTFETNPSHIFTNNDFSNTTSFNVELKAVSEYLCRDSIEVVIEVFPAINANFFVEKVAGCSPFTVSIDNLSLGVTDFVWDFGDGSPTSNDGNPVITHTYINLGSDPIDFILALNVNNTDGCDDYKEIVITVYPEVTADFTYNPDGCSPHDPELVNLSENAHYFLWQMGDGIISTQQNPLHIYYNHSYTDVATFNVSLFAESIYGCAALINYNIDVYPRPDISFYVENPQGCSPHDAVIVNQSIGGTDFSWDFGDGTNGIQDDASFTHLYEIDFDDSAEIYTIILEGSNIYGCDNLFNQQVIVFPNIEAALSTDVIQGCHPLTVSFTNESRGATAYSAFLWNYGDGQTSSNISPIHTHTFNNYSYTDPVTYNVMLVAFNENACSDTTYVDITVNPRPFAKFSLPVSSGCSPYEFQIVNTSVGALNYQWNMGDGNVFNHNTSFSHEYNQPAGAGIGIFTINLVVDNIYGCSHSYSQNVTVYPDITAQFDFVAEGCHPLNVSFNNTSIGANFYNWDFDDGSYSQNENPLYVFLNFDYENQESYDVTLSVVSAFGCIDSYSQTIIVNPLPLAAFDLSEVAGCSPFEPDIFNVSIGALNYLWSFGDGNNSNTVGDFSYEWNNTGLLPANYLVSLTAENVYGCSDATSSTIAVYPEVTTVISTENDLVEGCSRLNIQFYSSTNVGVTMLWNFGDGVTSTSINPLHVFSNYTANSIVYNVNLTTASSYLCLGYDNIDITVLPSPLADFRATPALQVFPSQTIYLENQTSPGDYSYIWSFGDGNTFNTDLRNPFYHNYNRDPGDFSTIIYEVELQAYNDHCYDSKIKYVTVTSPMPIAAFSPSTEGCTPFTVQFQNQSLYSYQYRWYFRDGAMSVIENPIHTFLFPGIYDVMLIAIGDGGVDTTYRRIEVFKNPTALFELVSPYVRIPDEPLRLVNKSELAEYFYWEFGDGNSSTEFEPVHFYSEPGMYSILLAVSTSTFPQCHDTLIIENAVRVEEICRIHFPNAFTPSLSGSSGGSYDLNNINNQVFFPLYEGIEQYELSVFNRWGEMIFYTTNPLIGWDGYHRGELVPLGAYVWKLNALCTNGNRIVRSGTVTLLR